MRAFGMTLVVGAAIAAWTSPAQASCESGPSLKGATLPPSGTENVPRNARLLIVPDEDLPQSSEAVAIEAYANAEPVPVAGWTVSDGIVIVDIVEPGELLSANAEYSIDFVPTEHWTGYDIGSWRPRVTFTTGDYTDDDLPELGETTIELGPYAFFEQGCAPLPLSTVKAEVAYFGASDLQGPFLVRFWGKPIGRATRVVVDHSFQSNGLFALHLDDEVETFDSGFVQVEVLDMAGNCRWSDVLRESVEASNADFGPSLLGSENEPEPESETAGGCSACFVGRSPPVHALAFLVFAVGLVAWRKRA